MSTELGKGLAILQVTRMQEDDHSRILLDRIYIMQRFGRQFGNT